jgi:hypothetical protein
MRSYLLVRPPRRFLLIIGFLLTGLVVLVTSVVTRGEQGASPPSRSVPTFGASSAAVPTDSVPSGSAPSPTTPAPGNGVPLQSFAPTVSADVYAAAAARALWGIDYARTTRDQVMAFWRRELATTVPAGTPAATTLAEARPFSCCCRC